MIFKTGDKVTVTHGSQSVPAVVSLASSNGVSLMLEFEAAIIKAGVGAYIGQMPVIKEGKVYRDLTGGITVLIEPAAPEE